MPRFRKGVIIYKDKYRIDFVYITLADFIVRAAYQMGKTPLLPIFAATLGATDAFLGLIISVSTVTGMLLKPLIGILSDRWGRRRWLIVGTLFFVGMPFLYRFVQTPEQLFVIRLGHGLATAIYGPVTVAYVAEQTDKQRAEHLGWFGMARSSGYIVGPGLAGWLLLTIEPVALFTIIGIMSTLGFVPILLLSESVTPIGRERQAPIQKQIVQGLKIGSSTPAVWLSGSLEFVVYIALYAAKAFLPIYGLSVGLNVALVGTFFSVQEATHVLLKPLFGRLGDRIGYSESISLGMLLMGSTLPFLTLTDQPIVLMSLSVLIGSAQALIFPSTIALISTQIDERRLGAGMGLLGTLQNGGKIAGPILAGILVAWLDFTFMFYMMGLLLLSGALVVYLAANRKRLYVIEQ